MRKLQNFGIALLLIAIALAVVYLVNGVALGH